MGKYFFLLIDAYTKWPEVYTIPNITTAITIDKCREIFSRFGIPEVLVSDNGSQFTSEEFRLFMEKNGIIHKRSAPYHPSTNGQVERNVQTLKNKLKTVSCNHSDIDKVVCNILLNYRRTPHATTGESPASLMFNRQIRSRLDIMLPTTLLPENPKCEMNSKLRRLQVDDRVSVRDYTSTEKYQFGIVIEVLGKLHYNVKLDDGRIWKRHINQIHKIGSIKPTWEDQMKYDYGDPGPVTHTHTQTPQQLTTIPAQDEEQNITNATPIVTGPAPIPERRPQRQIMPRKMLTYDEEFNQVPN
ncbi:uncharacterized protein K02A2.6-like [Rhagoletis pomonella]|uniref:uncharacterized protein K02A2.6-like n=1 Tax=Rhagoletis pomonella TaxID=28610 RepID=UPI00177D8A61|nr:uncharacterized protein K02A2.6-like [Rhagoletis pomonella]